jgi:Arc/MetJ-type ribon-helix-helix transcriptional regulator
LPLQAPIRHPDDDGAAPAVEVESEMDKVTIRLPRKYLKRLDFLVGVDDFPSRSEAIRTAVRDLLYNRLEYVMEKQKQMMKADMLDAEMEEIQRKYVTR